MKDLELLKYLHYSQTGAQTLRFMILYTFSTLHQFKIITSSTCHGLIIFLHLHLSTQLLKFSQNDSTICEAVYRTGMDMLEIRFNPAIAENPAMGKQCCRVQLSLLSDCLELDSLPMLSAWMLQIITLPTLTGKCCCIIPSIGAFLHQQGHQ